jgi:DNA-binding GntR family transcriptional regulator
MLHTEVVVGIRAMLLEGEIPPGARIPERELCEKLQISRTPLREALKVLAAEGLVQLLPTRGARASERINDAQLAEIEVVHAEMARHHHDRDLARYYRCNRFIHEAIVAAADNPVLSGLYESVTARIRRARYVTPMTEQRWALAMQEHEAILNMLKRRDGFGLAHILRTHLRHKREEVIRAGFAEDGEVNESAGNAGDLPANRTAAALRIAVDRLGQT